MDSEKRHLLKLLEPLMQRRQCLWDDCNIEFPNDYECMLHIKKDHVIKKHLKCLWKYCSYETDNPNNNVNHMKRHFNLIEGVCITCSASFKWKFDLKRHVSHFHKNEVVKTQFIKFQGFSVMVCKKDMPIVLNDKIAFLLN